MNRFLASLAAFGAIAAAARAQCYESNLGVLVPGGVPTAGLGDDNLFTLQPMNITFPMGGVAVSYTHAHISTNGVMYLTNGLASGGAASPYSTTAASVVTSLQGTAGQPPRIAPFLTDLNNLSANGGGVFVNNTIPGKFVVTWKNTITYSLALVETVQAQLYSNGEVHFFYSTNAQSQSTTFTFGVTVGVSQGNAIAAVPASNLSAGASSTTQLMFEQFTPGTFDLGGTTVSFVPNVSGGYDESVSACVPSSNSNYGTGCYNIAHDSFYENFASVGAFDLASNSLTLTPTGTGYVVTLGGGTFVTPVSPTVLVLGDDTQTTTPALTTPFPYPGGAAATLTVCSNGFISVASGNGTGFTPSVSTLLGNPQTGWYCWHDFNVTAPGSGQVKYEEIGGIAYVTWDGVYDYGGTTVADASTVQWQFNESTGGVVVVFGTMTTTGTSGTGFLVGYSPGGASLDPGNTDLDTSLPVITSPDVAALALNASPSPVLGSTLTWTTSNIPGTAVVSGNLLSFGQFNPGIDLTGAGAPGCFQFVDLSVSATALLLGSPTATNSLFLPPVAAYAGTNLYSQSVSLVPGANALGVITSNGVKSFINTF